MNAIISKILSGKEITPSSLLDELSVLFPLVSALAETPQDPEWHAEGDVRTHTEMVVAEAINIADSSLGAQLNVDDRLIHQWKDANCFPSSSRTRKVIPRSAIVIS